MPGFTTHYIMGMKAYNDLPANQLKHIIAKYRWLYQLGLQGPDIFFYYIPILRHRDYRNVGSYMHEHHVQDFFVNYLEETARISSKQQREQALAYFCGYICHYIGDSICHPFVYGRIQYDTANPSMAHHGLHAELENDIDALLLHRYKKKKPSELIRRPPSASTAWKYSLSPGFYPHASTEPTIPSRIRIISRYHPGWYTVLLWLSGSAAGLCQILTGASVWGLS